MDVEVVNPSGSTGTLVGQYRYDVVAPLLYVSGVDAWFAKGDSQIFLDHLVHGPIRLYVDGVDVKFQIWCCDGVDREYLVFRPQSRPPGHYSVILVNGDGGIAESTLTYYWPEDWENGLPPKGYHTADRNENYQLELSELLRVVQLYKYDAIHCDATTEDGFAPGDGDETCAPHASDHSPQDWRIELEELLEAIQFYNLHCYQPCPDDATQFCPPYPYY